MEIDQILGGVSPLKARSGKHARAATSTASKRGGYSKSTSSSNRGGYNRHTRFQADKWTPPPSGGDIDPVASTSAPVPTAPYSGGATNYTFGDDNSINDNRQDKSYNNNEVNQKNNATKDEVVNKVVEGETLVEGETPEKPKRGGFEEACLNADGTRKPAGSLGTDSNGKKWKCVWDPNLKRKSGGDGGGKGEGEKVENNITPTGGVEQSNNATINANRNSLLTAPSVTDNKKKV